MTATAKMYMGKTGVVLFSVAVAVFALLNAISTFTKYAPLSAVYLSKDLGFVWIGICIICTVSAGFAQTSRIEKARREVIVWYHFTCIEIAVFTLGVLFAYVIIGYKQKQQPQPGPYILYGVGFLLEILLIRHTWAFRREV